MCGDGGKEATSRVADSTARQNGHRKEMKTLVVAAEVALEACRESDGWFFTVFLGDKPMRTRECVILAVAGCAVALLLGVYCEVAHSVCIKGCFETSSACKNNSTYVLFSGNCAADPFWDPGAEPDKQNDVVHTRSMFEKRNCEYCTCTYSDCSYWCKGTHGGCDEAILANRGAYCTECVIRDS